MNSSAADHWPSMFKVIGQTLGLKKIKITFILLIYHY